MTTWKKEKDGHLGKHEDFVIRVLPKPDGRWTWDVTREGASSPLASGIAANANQAKRNAENFVQRGPGN